MLVIDGQSNAVARLSHRLSPLHLSPLSACVQTQHNKFNNTLVLLEILNHFFSIPVSVGQYLTNLCSLFWIKFQNVIPAWAVSLTCSVFSSSNPDTRRRIRKFVQNNTHCISLTPCIQNLRKIPITSQLGDLLVSTVKMLRVYFRRI